QRLLNGYGPTESTTFAAWHPIRSVPKGAASVPIGRPLANTTLFVLDHRGSPVPPGVAGELCIGGDGLARGYLHRSDLTAERFIPGDGGERLYRTGDRVRQRPDGILDYLGRLDSQVKIRGFRVELGEIEAALLAHAAVREAVVTVREEVPGDRRLVAYVAPHGAAPDGLAGGLREWLAGKLRAAMVPAAFVILRSLPVTANGKIDRRALPSPEADPADTYAAPADRVEEVLAGLFAELLSAPGKPLRV